MAVRSLHHVNVRACADDIRRLRDFYCEVVGLTEGWRPPFASRGHWLYAGDQPVMHLVEIAESAGDATSRPNALVDHIAFSCSDLEQVLSRLRALNVDHAISQVPVTGDTQVFFQDPLGSGVELNVGKVATR